MVEMHLHAEEEQFLLFSSDECDCSAPEPSAPRRYASAARDTELDKISIEGITYLASDNHTAIITCPLGFRPGVFRSEGFCFACGTGPFNLTAIATQEIGQEGGDVGGGGGGFGSCH